MTLYSESDLKKYALVSDQPEAVRLNKQHALMRILMEGKLLPDDIELRAGDRVLDSGTGTGIWALDLAAHLPPGAEIEAIDITPSLFPTSSPARTVSFHTQDILSLPSESYRAKYALVHQRFLAAAFSPLDWQVCLSNTYAALRPGGWIKLEELQGKYIQPQSDSLPNSSKIAGFAATIEGIRGIDFGAVENLEVWLREAGFGDVRIVRRRWMLGPGEENAPWREVMRGAWRALRLGALKAGNDLGYSDEEWETFLRDLEREYEENEAWVWIYDVVARKPFDV